MCTYPPAIFFQLFVKPRFQTRMFCFSSDNNYRKNEKAALKNVVDITDLSCERRKLTKIIFKDSGRAKE